MTVTSELDAYTDTMDRLTNGLFSTMLQAGASGADIDRLQSSVEQPLHPDVVELYGWSQGSVPERVSLFHVGALLDLEIMSIPQFRASQTSLVQTLMSYNRPLHYPLIHGWSLVVRQM